MFIWLIEVVRQLACIEVALQDELIQRESLHQVIRLNPEVFEPIINGLLYGEKDLQALARILELVESYMETKATLIFKPLLAYLSAERELRGISEVFQHIAGRLHMTENRLLFFDTCDWLVENELLQEMNNPVKLTPKSRITVNEPAYYYDGE